MPHRYVHRPWLRWPKSVRPTMRSTRQNKRQGGGGQILLSAVLGIGIALLVIGWVDGSVRPVMEDMALVKMQNAVTVVINDAVARTMSAETLAYEDIVSVEKDATGRVTAMTTSTPKLNALRTEILGDIVAQVDSLDTKQLGIPLGNLTGFAGASDRGPVLPVRVVSVAAAQAEFQNVFTAAGINQTIHQIMLHVSVTVQVLIPGTSLESCVDAQVLMAETVIVGQVPDAYLQFGGTGNGGGGIDANRTFSGADAASGGTGGSAVSASAGAPPSMARLRPAV